MKKITSITFLLLFFSYKGFCQFLPVIGQFQYAQLVYNPAYAGSSTNLRCNMFYRSQFIGVKGSASSQVLTVDAPVANQLGAGLTLYRYQVGATRQVALSGSLTYRIKFNKEAFFQFGMRAGVSWFRNNFNSAFVWDSGDELIQQSLSGGSVLRIGSGGFFKRKKFYVGLSAPDLLYADINKVFYDANKGKSTLRRNFVFNTGTEIYINEFTSLQPAILIRYYAGQPLDYFVNVGVELNQTVIIGASSNYPVSAGAYTRVSVSPKIKIGYQYEFSLKRNALGPFNTNEFIFSYGFD